MPAVSDASEVIRRVGGLASGGSDRTIWVGIDGRGATGKTTLAATIAGAVDVDVIHVDDFSSASRSLWDRDRFRRQVVEPLNSARETAYQIWDWDRDQGGQWIRLAPGRIAVVEGVSSTARELGIDWSLRVWVDAPLDVRLARALARDGEAMMSRWLEDWMPSEEAYIAAERPDLAADLTVATSVTSGTAPPF